MHSSRRLRWRIASVFTLDKDFSRIARLTGLPLYPLPGP
jgi:hypothetical protein